MTLEELKEAIEGFRKEGYTNEEIIGVFYLMYVDGEIPLEDLRTLTEATGYEFTEEFEAMSEEDKKKHGLKPSDKAEGVDKEDVEDAKEYEDGEEDGGKDDTDDTDDTDDAEDTKAEDDTEGKDKDKDDDEEDEDKKAARLFGFGGKND